MRLTKLVEPIDSRLQCNVCQWRCRLALDETGRCLVRARKQEGIVALNDSLISAANVGLVENHRLWHFFPGTSVLSIGSWGYAFPADQQRGQYAQIPDDESRRKQREPDRVASVALERLCRGVIWAYNDPSVSQEYVLEVLQFSRANSRYTALVTSGYLTIEAFDQIGHYLDGVSLDLRGFDDAAYRRLAGVEHWRGILEIAAYARQRWNCHIEVTTRLHPGVNDAPEQIAGMVNWIRDTLGAWTPWHVLPGDAGSAAAATVGRARRIALESGLQFVYGPEPTQDTVCNHCGASVIERRNNGARVVGLEGGNCAVCGMYLHIRTSIFKRS